MVQATAQIKITADTAAVYRAIAQAQQLAESSPEFRYRLLDFLNAPRQVVGLNVDTAATPTTNQVRVFLQPTNAFLDLLSAYRTIEG